jgi:hypothetical protein
MVPVLSEQITFTQPKKTEIIIHTFRFLIQQNSHLKNLLGGGGGIIIFTLKKHYKKCGGGYAYDKKIS